MIDHRRQIVGLIRQFTGLAECPHRDDSLGCRAYGCALRHNQKAGAGLAARQVIAEVMEHGPAIMGHKHAAYSRCMIEQFGIAKAVQTSLSGRSKIDAWFLPPHCFDDCEFKVVVCLEA